MPSRHRDTTDQKRSHKRPSRRDCSATGVDPGQTVSDNSLAALLERITPANRHQEVDWGPQVGKEMW